MKERVSAILGEEVKSCRLMTQSSSTAVYNCDNRIVAKVATDPWLVESEELMYEYLRDNSTLPIPKLYGRDNEVLLTEYIPNDQLGRLDAERDAALHLANLHRIGWEEGYGFVDDTVIGPYRQNNTPYDSWIEFFRRERLLDFATKAFAEEQLPEESYLRLIALCEDLERYLIEPKHSSLLHGDVWSGNVLIHRGEVAAFIDPAIYYGHHEVDLAFIMMFSTFGDRFFEHYHKLYPIEEDFVEVRADIYNLYPYLVHLRAFGEGYLPYIERTLQKYGY
ncbi:MAG TPA: fructosamine kinase [Campylobacteraceae bacterium]|jgi:fructosamine-3-kinase|nr:fructosamine kinase [Campylobacteraceae bacterium]